MAVEIPLPDNRTLSTDAVPLIMGILNATPDSFYAESRRTSVTGAFETAMAMEQAGADIIDVGGESTRPGAVSVRPEEEVDRVIPVIEAIRQRSSIAISVDTRNSLVAREAIEHGADIVNDISALRHDAAMLPLIVESGVPVVIMHMQGTPETMQENPSYTNVVVDIFSWLKERAHALVGAGVSREKIMIDPGIGFGKTLEHNLQILRELPTFVTLGYPVVIGASRKGFIGRIMAGTDDSSPGYPPESRGAGSLAVHCQAAQAGVSVLRVHDVEETVSAMRTLKAIWNGAYRYV